MISNGEIEFRVCPGGWDASREEDLDNRQRRFFWTQGTDVFMTSKATVIGMLAVGVLCRRSVISAQKAIDDLKSGDGEFTGDCDDLAFTLARVSNLLESCRSECAIFDKMLVSGATELMKEEEA